MKVLFSKTRFWATFASLIPVAQILAVVACVMAWPHAALASSAHQAQYLGDMFCAVALNLIPQSNNVGGFGLGQLINSVAYIAGILTIGSGLLLLVKRADDPGGRNTPLYQPLARLIGGCGLLSLPSIIQWLFNTLALQPQGSGVYTVKACSGGVGDFTPAYGGIFNGGITLDMLMQNLVYNIADPMTLFLSVLSIIIGMVLVFRGLSKASKYGLDPKANSVPAILANLIIGAILVTVGSSLDVIFNTIFGGNTGIWYSNSLWSNLSPNFTSAFDNAGELSSFIASVTAALTFFQLIGFIAFIRGWLILKNHVEGTGNTPMAQGLTHIFGGALAINIYQIMIILDHTFGTGFIS